MMDVEYGSDARRTDGQVFESWTPEEEDTSEECRSYNDRDSGTKKKKKDSREQIKKRRRSDLKFKLVMGLLVMLLVGSVAGLIGLVVFLVKGDKHSSSDRSNNKRQPSENDDTSQIFGNPSQPGKGSNKAQPNTRAGSKRGVNSAQGSQGSDNSVQAHQNYVQFQNSGVSTVVSSTLSHYASLSVLNYFNSTVIDKMNPLVNPFWKIRYSPPRLCNVLTSKEDQSEFEQFRTSLRIRIEVQRYDLRERRARLMTQSVILDSSMENGNSNRNLLNSTNFDPCKEYKLLPPEDLYSENFPLYQDFFTLTQTVLNPQEEGGEQPRLEQQYKQLVRKGFKDDLVHLRVKNPHRNENEGLRFYDVTVQQQISNFCSFHSVFSLFYTEFPNLRANSDSDQGWFSTRDFEFETTKWSNGSDTDIRLMLGSAFEQYYPDYDEQSTLFIDQQLYFRHFQVEPGWQVSKQHQYFTVELNHDLYQTWFEIKEDGDSVYQRILGQTGDYEGLQLKGLICHYEGTHWLTYFHLDSNLWMNLDSISDQSDLSFTSNRRLFNDAHLLSKVQSCFTAGDPNARSPVDRLDRGAIIMLFKNDAVDADTVVLDAPPQTTDVQ